MLDFLYQNRNTMQISTTTIDPSRITLRPFELTDADDFFSWASDPAVVGPLYHWTVLTDKDEAVAAIRDVCIPHPWRRSICLDNRSAGFVSIFPGSGDDRCRANFGYAVKRELWGRGVATRAVKLAVSEAFGDLPEVVRLEALVDVENGASQRVLEKAGFTKECLLRKYGYNKGVLQDLYVYSFLSNDAILD